MKYLGLDYGTKRVGVALSDTGGIVAFPKTVLANDDMLVRAIAELAAAEEIGAVVIGEPKTLEGHDNPLVVEVERFIELLAQKLEVPIHREREAFSSVEAGRFAPKGQKHDDAAAAIILQRFLDAHAGSA